MCITFGKQLPKMSFFALVRAEQIVVTFVITLHRRTLPVVFYRASGNLTRLFTGNFPWPRLTALTGDLPRPSLPVTR